MSQVKKILIFILITISLYWTVLFYLVTTSNSNIRLGQIEYIDALSRLNQKKRVIYIDEVEQFSSRSQRFKLERFILEKNQSQHQECTQQKTALLVVTTTDDEHYQLFSKLLLEVAEKKNICNEIQVFVLRRKKYPLIFSSEDNIKIYTNQIGEAIKFLTIQKEYYIYLFGHEEGGLLCLSYFARKNINILFRNIVERIKRIILVDPYHPSIKIEHDPPYSFLEKIKSMITNQRQRLNIVNNLKIVIVTSYKENRYDQQIFKFMAGKDTLFQHTHIISTREIANIHYYLPHPAISFIPFMRRMGEFISMDHYYDLNGFQVDMFLRFGESWPEDKFDNSLVKQEDNKKCQQINLRSKKKVRKSRSSCIYLLNLHLSEDQVFISYASNYYNAYVEMRKVYPFDNLTEGSIYLFQKSVSQIFISNPNGAEISFSKQIISKKSLQISDEEIVQTSQITLDNLKVVNVCKNNLLIFPIHFDMGTVKRNFLISENGKIFDVIQEIDDQCIADWGPIDEFEWQLFQKWHILRNLMIFSLLCSHFRNQKNSIRIVQQLAVNYFLLYYQTNVDYVFINAIHVTTFAILIEYLIKTLIYLCSYLNLNDKKASIYFMAVIFIVLFGNLLDLQEYLQVFVLSLIFFINEQSSIFLTIKMYFIYEEVFKYCYIQTTNICLLTAWIYVSLLQESHPKQRLLHEKIFCGILIASVALTLNQSGAFVETLINIYMKIIITIKMMKSLTSL